MNYSMISTVVKDSTTAADSQSVRPMGRSGRPTCGEVIIRALRCFSVLAVVLWLGSTSVWAQTIERVEPECWWTGMKTDLQLMIYGHDIGRYNKVSTSDKNIKIRKVYAAHSPNYLFVDIGFGIAVKAGTYDLILTDGKDTLRYGYTFRERRSKSASRAGVSSTDALYLLVPDRFANSSMQNDSSPQTIETVDRANPAGRHGGDLRGIIDHLDYLQKLGVTALASTPMLLDDRPRGSYRGDACADYYRIDPRFGDNVLYVELVRELHQRDMKIVMDFVTNHCGMAHWWMNDLPFSDWINYVDSPRFTNHALLTAGDPNAAAADLEALQRGWLDNTMPDMNLSNDFVRQYLVQCAVWWIEWADLDGLRVDFLPYNDKKGISQWCKAVTREYPNLNITGECRTGYPTAVAYWMGDNANRDRYNSNMPSVFDFPLREAIVEGLGAENPAAGEGVQLIYDVVAQDMVYKHPQDLTTLLSDHRTEPVADLLKGDAARIKMAYTILATMRGIPQIYYGDEWALRALGRGDDSCRIDFPGGWTGDGVNLFERRGASEQQQEVFEHVSKLLTWRRTGPAVLKGRLMQFVPSENCYVYFRYTAKNVAMVVVNASRNTQRIDWERYVEVLPQRGRGTELLTGESVTIGQSYSVRPMTSAVVEFEKR